MEKNVLVWEKCDYTFPAGFIATFGSQGTCSCIVIVNGRTEQTPRATASLDIVGGGRGGRGARVKGWGGVGRSGQGRVGGRGSQVNIGKCAELFVMFRSKEHGGVKELSEKCGSDQSRVGKNVSRVGKNATN